MTKQPNFKIDVDDNIGLGVPLWYIAKIKKNQMRMLKDRGYAPRPQDKPYLDLNQDNIAQHLDTIKPSSLKIHMSGSYTLSTGRQSKINGKYIGEYIYVHYPEFILSKDETQIKQEGTDLVRDIMMRLEIKDSVDSKGNIVINADQNIYQDIFSEFITKGSEGLKGKNRWVFNNKNGLIKLFIENNKKIPAIRRIMIISYAGISSNGIKELKNKPIYYFENFTYKKLSHIPIDHIRSPKFKLLSSEEWNIIKNTIKDISKANISQRYDTCPITKYYGAVIGDVFEVKHKNMSSFSTLTHRWQNINYRVVVRDPDSL